MLSKKILILDKGNVFPEIFFTKLEKELNLTPIIVRDFLEAKNSLYSHNSNFFLAMIDFDSSQKDALEHVDYLLNNGIPCVLVAPIFNESVRQSISAKDIIDYIYKGNEFNVDYSISLIDRLLKNPKRKVLVVEDSTTYRKYITGLLEIQMFKVMEASHGKEALLILEKNPDIQLILTDYNMPYMDGFELTKIIRQKFPKDVMAILAISDNESLRISSSFLKFGANDYIKKPFSKEEFFCRINLNIDILENFQKLKDAAYRDYLTGLFNRRYFFEKSKEFFKRALHEKKSFSIGIADIDYFKKINDNYGHDIGDIALRFVADMLQAYLPSEGIVGRMGGEEFCILLFNYDLELTKDYFESIRRRLERIPISIGEEKTIQCTISIGVTSNMKNRLDEMIKEADEMLYEAKTSGRNQVCFASYLNSSIS